MSKELETHAAWLQYFAEHAEEIPKLMPRGSPENRERQRQIARVYMRFVRERGNPFMKPTAQVKPSRRPKRW
jgi:hypothetical protein